MPAAYPTDSGPASATTERSQNRSEKLSWVRAWIAQVVKNPACFARCPESFLLGGFRGPLFGAPNREVDQLLAAKEAFPHVVTLTLGDDQLDGVLGSMPAINVGERRGILCQGNDTVFIAMNQENGKSSLGQQVHARDRIELSRLRLELLGRQAIGAGSSIDSRIGAPTYQGDRPPNCLPRARRGCGRAGKGVVPSLDAGSIRHRTFQIPRGRRGCRRLRPHRFRRRQPRHRETADASTFQPRPDRVARSERKRSRVEGRCVTRPLAKG